MTRAIPFIVAGTLLLAVLNAGGTGECETMGHRELTPEEEYVIVHGGTERPYTGRFLEHFEEGLYTCRRCGAPLFSSGSKFSAGCGWPAFDLALEGAVEELPDPDGLRTEIRCASCGGHLGHVFAGEGFTETDTRHCVNSISMDFIPAENIETAYFAGGCFWGIEDAMEMIPGVLEAVSGYMGGTTANPSYEEVCSGVTGHAETVRVVFDRERVTYRELAMAFFELHDPTQVNRQGPDHGSQYRSAVFHTSEAQRNTASELREILVNKGLAVATELSPAGEFHSAEDYHQNYYARHGVRSSCHRRVSRF